MAYESWHMQHCVGQFDDRKNLTGGYGEYYANQIEQHKLRLFSLRDNNNIPHVTIALNVVGDSLEIDQIKVSKIVIQLKICGRCFVSFATIITTSSST